MNILLSILAAIVAISHILNFYQTMLMKARMDAIEKRDAAMQIGFDQLNKAGSPDEIKTAVHNISTSWNKP